MDKLSGLLQELQTRFPQHGSSNQQVSAVDAGWHMEHSMLVIRRSIRAILESDPKNYKAGFNLRAFLFFNVLRKIPRGKTKAPEVVMPASDISEASLLQSLEKTKALLGDFSKAAPKQFFRHGMLGNLDRERSRQLLEIHTEHHLKIIREISGD